jgi:hypothetical protein
MTFAFSCTVTAIALVSSHHSAAARASRPAALVAALRIYDAG